MHHWMENHRVPGTLRFGRRTLILLHGGVVWIVYGVITYVLPTPRFTGGTPFGTLLDVLDSPAMGLLWIVGGMCALINAPLRKRWHGRDALGFLGLLIPSLWWFISYLWAIVAHFEWGRADSFHRALPGLVLFYFLSFMLLLDGGWPDPNDPTIARRGDAEIPQ